MIVRANSSPPNRELASDDRDDLSSSGGTYDARGLVWYSSDGGAAFASKATCTLAPADGDLCGPVLDFVRALLPAPPPGSSAAAIAPLVPPAP